MVILYAYAANNPVKYTDPDGRVPFLVVTAAIGAVAGAAYGAYKSYSQTGEVNWGEVGRDAALGACIGLMGGAVAAQAATASFSAVTGYGTATTVATGVAATESSIWTLDKFARGWEAEQRLGGMMNNFPVIDKFKAGVNGFAQSITSIKSMDLGCKTYQRGSAIFSKLASYVDKVANFTTSTMSGLTVSANNSTQRILELAIPSGANPEQMKAIQDATTYAMQKGVEVIVHVIE